MNVLYIGAIVGFIQAIPWSAVFMITQFFGIRLYQITREDDCARIQRKAGNRFSEVGNGGKGQGYTVGRWFILHLTSGERDMAVWLVATKASYEYLIADTSSEIVMIEGSDEPAMSTNIRIVQRYGSFASPWLKTREITMTATPRQDQLDIMNSIITHQEKHKHTIAYIWGPPGGGKSMIGLFLAQRLNGTYCNTLKPWQPNDRIETLYAEFDPSEESPCVLVFDEVDSAISAIHSNSIPDHKNLPTAVKNKVGWNALLDDVQRGLYPHLILILTTNKSPDIIREMDPSYIREGRVDLIMELA